jgi:hypothetical protein
MTQKVFVQFTSHRKNREMTKEFKAPCVSCKKPLTTKDGKTPDHTIGVVRSGKVVQVKCPGSGKKPN